MKQGVLKEKYFNWLCDLVAEKRASYRKLFRTLHQTEFYAVIPMDENRADDGINLRYRFGHDVGVSDNDISNYLSNSPCSLLEMMVALAVRCEGFMDNPDLGDRTKHWFWVMIHSLGLEEMTDDRFDDLFVQSVLFRLLSRSYKANGRGGLFTLKNPPEDMRKVEIWYQLNWYLTEQYDK